MNKIGELTIRVSFETEWQMEENLNKAIDDLSSVLKKKGLRNMDLLGVDEKLNEIYKVTINQKTIQQ